MIALLAAIDPAVWAGAAASLLLAYAGYRRLPSDTANSAADAASKNVTSSLAIVERLEKDVASLRDDLRTTREELQTTRSEQRAEIGALRRELDVVRAERDELRQENTRQRRQINQQASRIAALEDEVHGARGT